MITAVRCAFASALVGLAVLAIPDHASAETFRVEDTASLPSETTALLHWREFAPSGGTQETLEGSIAVAVRRSAGPPGGGPRGEAGAPPGAARLRSE